jgi:putative intracellular protease/amidase
MNLIQQTSWAVLSASLLLAPVAITPTAFAQTAPVTTSAEKAPAPAMRKRVIGIVLYPGFEVLDVFGPTEMWANVPDIKVVTVAQTKGLVRSAQGVSVQADYGFDDAPKFDVVMVPGGRGTFTELNNPVFLAYLVKADRDSEFTTSVCTGSALLAKAGLLKGHRATSNKKFFSVAVDQDPSVVWAKSARWVEDGKYLTSSGVSAGTDMALGLLSRIYGPEHTRMLARTLEYQWSEDPTNDPFAIK